MYAAKQVHEHATDRNASNEGIYYLRVITLSERLNYSWALRRK